MRRLVVAPEPAAWLPSVLREGDVLVAPWAVERPRPGIELWRIPAWRWLRGAAARLIEPLALKLYVRRQLDAVVALAAHREAWREVVAPSLAAQRTFAALPTAKRTLMVDLPQLTHLHEDLDAAAMQLPHCSFLRHHRAPHAAVVQQLEEYRLASARFVRGAFAHRALKRLGLSSEPMTPNAPATLLRHDPESRRVLLAGTTASRFGLEVALKAVERSAGLTLFAKHGVGSNQPSLLHPRLRVLDERAPLPSVAMVWAPAWVECSPVEVEAAAEAQIPVVATSRALGWLERGTLVQQMTPGDSSALTAAARCRV